MPRRLLLSFLEFAELSRLGVKFLQGCILYKGVSEVIMLYAACVWAHSMIFRCYRDIFLRAQCLLLAIVGGYRTVSQEAACVITGIKLIDILAIEHKEHYISKQWGLLTSERLQEIENKGFTSWQAR